MNVCKPGAGADCCAYLVVGSQGFECARLTNMKFVIDLRLADGSMNAMGDNCEGIGESKTLVDRVD